MDKEFSLKDRILVLTNEDFSKSLVLHEECGKAGQHEFESLPDAVDYAATIFSSVEPRSELEDLINELDNLLVALGASKDATYSYDAIAEYSKCAILTLVDGNRMVLIDNDVLLGYFAATVNDAGKITIDRGRRTQPPKRSVGFTFEIRFPAVIIS